MKFTEWTVCTTSAATELVADIMWQYTTYGVAVCDFADVKELIEKRRETFDYIEEELLAAEQNAAFVKAYCELNDSVRVAPLLRADLENLKVRSAGNIDVGTLELTSRVDTRFRTNSVMPICLL